MLILSTNCVTCVVVHVLDNNRPLCTKNTAHCGWNPLFFIIEALLTWFFSPRTGPEEEAGQAAGASKVLESLNY